MNITGSLQLRKGDIKNESGNHTGAAMGYSGAFSANFKNDITPWALKIINTSPDTYAEVRGYQLATFDASRTWTGVKVISVNIYV